MAESAEEHGLDKKRIESLTDGLFATVMTILVLSLVVPVVLAPNVSAQLDSAIIDLLPSIFVYAASFIVLGIMWVGHNNLFRYIHQADRKLQWINLLLLLCIGLVPFSTAFLGRYPLQQPAILLYGVNFLITAVVFSLLTYYAVSHHKLMHKEATSNVSTGFVKGNFLSVIIYALALICSFVSPYISLGLFAFMPVFYITRGITLPG